MKYYLLLIVTALFCNFIANILSWSVVPDDNGLPGWASYVCGEGGSLTVVTGTGMDGASTESLRCQSGGVNAATDSIRFFGVTLLASSVLAMVGMIILVATRLTIASSFLNSKHPSAISRNVAFWCIGILLVTVLASWATVTIGMTAPPDVLIARYLLS